MYPDRYDQMFLEIQSHLTGYGETDKASLKLKYSNIFSGHVYITLDSWNTVNSIVLDLNTENTESTASIQVICCFFKKLLAHNITVTVSHKQSGFMPGIKSIRHCHVNQEQSVCLPCIIRSPSWSRLRSMCTSCSIDVASVIFSSVTGMGVKPRLALLIPRKSRHGTMYVYRYTFDEWSDFLEADRKQGDVTKLHF